MSDSQAARTSQHAGVYDDRPWTRHYASGVQADIDIPSISLPDMLAATVRTSAHSTFAIFYGRRFSFAEVERSSNRCAHRLIELGLKPGEPVLVILPNVPQFLTVAYGILKAGGIIAAVNPLLTRPEIQRLAEDSGARIVVTLDRFWDAVEPLLDSATFSAALVTGVQDGLPRLKRWLYPLKYRAEMVDVPHDPPAGRYQLMKLLEGAPDGPSGVAVSADQVAVFQYTGGTTGLPKAAVLTHSNLVANAYQVRAWLTDVREGQETVMAILPFFHAYGGTLCLFLAVRLAATIVLVPRFDAKDVMDLIEAYAPTILPGVPTLYNALNRAAENNPKRQQALRSIRYCISGGAPLPPDVQQRFEELTGGHLVEGYGLSEASPVTHINPLDGRARNGTIGLPISNTEVRLIDPESGEIAPAGEPGELHIRGPQVMQGYWMRPEDTAAVLDAQGWLHTGDIGVMDEDGFFRIVDRLKDVIITGGENIYPREIEDILMSHPKIHEVAVAGVKHQVGGEVAKAYIVLRPGETMDRREVLQFCSDKLAKYKVPRQIEFREELPKSAAGKILRRALEPADTSGERGSESGSR